MGLAIVIAEVAPAIVIAEVGLAIIVMPGFRVITAHPIRAAVRGTAVDRGTALRRLSTCDTVAARSVLESTVARGADGH